MWDMLTIRFRLTFSFRLSTTSLYFSSVIIDDRIAEICFVYDNFKQNLGSRGIPKRALNIYRVFRKLSFVNQPGFLGRISLENPSFFYFQKGRWLSAPDVRPFFHLREDGFFVFSHNYSVPEKGRRRKWRSKVKNPNQANSKPNRTTSAPLPVCWSLMRP